MKRTCKFLSMAPVLLAFTIAPVRALTIISGDFQATDVTGLNDGGSVIAQAGHMPSVYPGFEARTGETGFLNVSFENVSFAANPECSSPAHFEVILSARSDSYLKLPTYESSECLLSHLSTVFARIGMRQMDGD